MLRCPFEARTVVAEKIHRRLIYNIHFRQAMVENFKNNFDIFKEHLPHIERDHVSKVRLGTIDRSIELARTIISLSHVLQYFWMEDFDDDIMRPLSGAETLEEYYVNSGCLDYISKVSIPVLVAHANDDPVVPHHMLPVADIENNPELFFIRTNAGGHTGWLSGLNPRGTSWFDHVALEWVNQVLHYNEQHGVRSPPVSPRLRRTAFERAATTLADLHVSCEGHVRHTRSKSRQLPDDKAEEARSPSRAGGVRERRPTSRMDL